MFIIECLKWEKETLRTILLCTLVILPLCFVKDWESLSILSKIKAVVYASLVLFVLIVPPFDQWTQENVVRDMDDFIHDQKTWFSLNIYKSLGTFTFGTVYHDCIFPVKKTMKDQSLSGWSKVSKFALFMVTVISGVLGVGGFVNFRIKEHSDRQFKSNIFSNGENDRLFGPNNKLFDAARMILVALMLMTVPMCVHVARDYIDAIKIKISGEDKITSNVNESAMAQTIEGGNATTNVMNLVKIMLMDQIVVLDF